MTPLKKSLTLTVASLSLLLAGCDDSNSTQENSFELMLSALGGEETLAGDRQINYQTQGTAYEFQEQPEPVAQLVSHFTQDINATLNGENLRQQWFINNDYAFDINLEFTELMVGDNGVVIEGPNTFAAYAFGGWGQPSDPMTSVKYASREKTWFMSSPLAIVSHMVSQGHDQLSTQYQGQTVTLELDPKTNLPKLASTLELDPLYGDVRYQVEYLDWQVTGDTQYPMHIISRVDGHVIRDVTLSQVSFGDTGNQAFNLTGLETKAKAANEGQAGYLSSQFYMRSLMMGFPFDAIEENNVVSQFIDADNKVLRITGVEHYNYAFAIDGKVYLYDAVINNARQQAVLAEVSRQFPNLPMGGVIISHDHFDHAGGFRGALTNGGDLIVGAASGEFYEELVARPHTLEANPLLQRDDVPVVQTVNGKLILGEGNETLEIYTVAQGHASEDDMLILYRPQDKTLFFADLYNGGFEGLSFLPELVPTIKKRAQLLLDFVEQNSLDVINIAPLHGDVEFSTKFESVKAAAAL